MSNFKVNDWVNLVRDDGIIFDTFQYDNDWNGKNGFSLELWRPKEDEWCWFYNSDNYDSVQLTLGKFYGTSSKELKYTYIDMDRQEYSSECCEPFIPGKLPSIIKDN